MQQTDRMDAWFSYSRFYDSGIVELLVEAGVGSEGSIRSAMKGSDVKFGIRCYKILFQAILRTKIEFITENVAEFSELPLFNNLKITNLCKEGVCPEKVESIINDVDILPTLDGNITKWMDLLLSMIDLLLNLIFFQRTGNWKGYLEAKHTFLPWCFALNRHNYTRNLSYFYVDMLNIEKNAPQAHQNLATDGFTGSFWAKIYHDIHGPSD